MGRKALTGWSTCLALTLVTVLFLGVAAEAGKVMLPEGTQIKVRFPANVKISSGKLGAGVPLLFNLEESITIGGKAIVEKGAEGTAVIKEVVKASKPGKAGKIVIDFVDLQPKGAFKTPENAKIKLSGSITAEGKGKKLMSYLFIFGLFIKGGQGEISPNVSYTAQIAESIILEE
jgi:hypothetical protein